ncbi:hypothetical protein Syncc8109_1097 [Synechococcus sp. WH 8109]|uniref:hypothetical protein n=1 Tax=Synechococcus sp. WH 8109 TaxID=166314 RepID=UPI0003E00DDE|nr:hypothetical protein [Synechococcus sp. WH 8109]AHF63468.1 hypothetical protein Syncc8109_1097 [Synechococcus sp. WH 8109]
MIWIRTSLAAAGLAVTTAIPASAEIVASTCRLLSYDGPITTVETFRCDFMQQSGNILVNSAEHEFSFLAAEQGETYIRINSIPMSFTRTGEYTLEVTQSPWLR